MERCFTYNRQSAFCIVKLDPIEAAQDILSRSILINSIYERWGSAPDYESLHADLMARSSPPWGPYVYTSFRFIVDDHQHKRPKSELIPLFESFGYMDLKGPIKMRDPEIQIAVCEDYELQTAVLRRVHIGRLLGSSKRKARIMKFDLKKRKYISTTSMDSELALVTANLVRAGKGRLIYDPFSGTGSFPIACAEFGAMTLGSDLDGRSVRGTPDRNVLTNFRQYGLVSKYLDSFVSDMTNSPLRVARCLDGIVCDPPYGIREGLKVLGGRNGPVDGPVIRDGQPAH
jgi:tRNA (guanine10-N2)-methyltransferase